MDDILTMRCSNSGSNSADNFESPGRRHGSFIRHDLLQRTSIHKLHDEKRHGAAHDPKVSHGDDVLMFDRCGCQRFLAKAGNEHRVVTNEVWQNYFDGMLGLEEDVTTLKDDSHSALSQPALQLITSIQNGITEQRGQSCIAVLGTVIYVVGETAPTG